VHVPFLLRTAAVPDNVLGELVVNNMTGAAEMELKEDEELGVTDEDFAAEAMELPQMMQHAEMWDNFLAYVATAAKP